jgi:Fe-S cluster assembly protein SufD
MGIAKLIESGALRPFKGSVIDNTTDCSLPFVALNDPKFRLSVDTAQPVRLVVAATESVQGSVEIELAAHSSLSLVVWLAADSYLSVSVKQAEGSQCDSFVSVVSGSDATFNFDLNGVDASNRFNAIFVANGSDHAKIALTTRHNVSDCKSNSLIKGVAMDRATGEFRGLVYVAPDAQRTDAQQQNRNIELDNSHIVALPQLEIYADDVRCSHGSTVGYADEQALFYMRQRGLDMATARRLQIEGFIEDVVGRCNLEPICCLVRESVNNKLSTI